MTLPISYYPVIVVYVFKATYLIGIHCFKRCLIPNFANPMSKASEAAILFWLHICFGNIDFISLKF